MEHLAASSPVLVALLEKMPIILDTIEKLDGAIGNRETRNLLKKAKEFESDLGKLKAELGKELDYQLCKCTFPPQICLLAGHDESSLVEISKCPECERIYPPGIAIPEKTS